MKKDLIIFLTHNFKEKFLNTLYRVNNDPNIIKYEVIVLFDKSSSEYNNNISKKLKNIKFIKESLIKSSYDLRGHTMYINFLQRNINIIDNFNYIWIVENDVYYHGETIINFMDSHKLNKEDVLCCNYGSKPDCWPWPSTLKGFNNIYKFGMLGVIMRLSNKILLNIIENIDLNYFGFFESLIPNVCLNYNFTISNFKSEYCGIINCGKGSKEIRDIQKEIMNKSYKNVEKNKIYHPIKL
jgi:hypothetical protein